MMHVELTNGQSAELREISTLTEGDAEDLEAAIYDSIPRDEKGEPLPTNPMRWQRQTERALLALVVESWTLDLPVPTATSLEEFRKISPEDALLLRDATKSYVAALIPNFGQQSQDPGSPTPPSAA